jgi:hypothetical protein
VTVTLPPASPVPIIYVDLLLIRAFSIGVTIVGAAGLIVSIVKVLYARALRGSLSTSFCLAMIVYVPSANAGNDIDRVPPDAIPALNQRDHDILFPVRVTSINPPSSPTPCMSSDELLLYEL